MGFLILTQLISIGISSPQAVQAAFKESTPVVTCEVTLEEVRQDLGASSTMRSFDNIKLTPAEIAALPLSASPADPNLRENPLRLPDFDGTLVNEIKTSEEKQTEIYEGHFARVLSHETYARVGDIITLLPTRNWWVEDYPKVFTTENARAHLSAVWILPKEAHSAHDAFGVSAQIWRQQFRIVSAVFTGTKTIRKPGLLWDTKTTQLLKDEALQFDGTPIKDGSETVKTAAFRTKL